MTRSFSSAISKDRTIDIPTGKRRDQSLHKRMRHQVILDLVSRQPVANQNELVCELEKMNIYITQATASRDITELNLIKTSQGYLSKKTMDDLNQLLILQQASLLRLSILRVQVAMSFVVVHTIPNTARFTAGVIDGTVFPEVIGTVSDWNTVLVVTHSPEDAQKVKHRIVKSMS